MSRRLLVVAAVVAQLLILLAVVAPRLSPRLRGDEVRIEVAPVDPIDPFRGAYVDLDYARADPGDGTPDLDGDVHVALVGPGRNGAYRLGRVTRERPVRGRFLRCRIDGSLSCGIDSFFASQDEARRLERELVGRRGEGRAVARVRIDGAGRAALVGLEPSG